MWGLRVVLGARRVQEKKQPTLYTHTAAASLSLASTPHALLRCPTHLFVYILAAKSLCVCSSSFKGGADGRADATPSLKKLKLALWHLTRRQTGRRAIVRCRPARPGSSPA